jgi:hypothetical protein
MIEIYRGVFPRQMTVPFIVQRGGLRYRGIKSRKSGVKRESVPCFAGRSRLCQSGLPTLSVGASDDHRPNPTSWGDHLILSLCVMLRRSGAKRATISTVR